MSARTVLVISAGLRTPSSTRLLADRLSEAALAALRERGTAVDATTVELREHARDLTSLLLTGVATPALTELFDRVASADAMVLVTPIYSGAYTGMVKDLVDVLPPDALERVPVLIGGTGGTVRHSLALDHTLRPLLTHVRAVVVPTAVFAATEDFGSVHSDFGQLSERATRAATELADLVAGGPRPAGRDPSDVSRVAQLIAEL